MANIINPNGLLAYGDNDPNNPVIWRSALTSAASILTPEIGGGTFAAVGSGQLFDATKGLNTGSAGYYTVTNITNNDKLSYGGSISFEVETAMIAASSVNASQSSGGRPQSGTETFLSIIANPSPNPQYAFYVDVSNKVISLVLGYGSNVALYSIYISDAIGKTQFSTITLSWTGNTMWVFVNDVRVMILNRAVNLPTPHYKILFGRYPDNASNPLTSGYIRNLQISSRPVSFVVPAILANVIAFGDSYADSNYVNTAIVAPGWDMEKLPNMEAEFFKLGMRFGTASAQSYGGRKVIGSGNAALYLKDNIVTLLSAKPTLIIDQSGPNDLTNTGTLDIAAFTAAKKDHIEQYFGVNGNPATTLLRAVICSTPWAPQYGGSAAAELKKPDITSINTIQAGLPAWFNATYPALAGRLIYQDTFTDFGGFNPDPTFYDPADLLHPGMKGRYWMGRKSWAVGALKALR